MDRQTCRAKVGGVFAEPCSDENRDLGIPPQSHNLRSNREMDLAGTFFITKCLHPRIPVLTESMLARAIIETLARYRREGQLLLAAFVVMPDHWHVLLGVPAPGKLAAVMKRINGSIGKHTAEALRGRGTAWQDGYYDTGIRTGRQFTYVRHYIEENPLRARLVAARSDWPWSSCNWEWQRDLDLPWPWPFNRE